MLFRTEHTLTCIIINSVLVQLNLVTVDGLVSQRP